MKKITNFFIFAAGFLMMAAVTFVGVAYLLALWDITHVFRDEILLQRLVGTILAAMVMLFGRDRYNSAIELTKQ